MAGKIPQLKPIYNKENNTYKVLNTLESDEVVEKCNFVNFRICFCPESMDNKNEIIDFLESMENEVRDLKNLLLSTDTEKIDFDSWEDDGQVNYLVGIHKSDKIFQP